MKSMLLEILPSDFPMAALLIFGVVIAVSVLFTRWVFEIPTLIRLQRQQRDLLEMIAKRLGAIDEPPKEQAGNQEIIEGSRTARLERLKWRHNLAEITQKQYDEERQKILQEPE